MREFPAEDVSVAEVMQARDERAARQRRYLQKCRTLICLTMNIPGPRKVSPLIDIAFQEGCRLIGEKIQQAVLAEKVLRKTGFEAYFLTDKEPEEVKRILCAIEDGSRLGRLFDCDVLSARGGKVSREDMGFSPRRCFLCGRDAFVCARSRTHTVPEMMQKINRDISAFYRDQIIRSLRWAAVQALKREARTTPKPGLVDGRNCGSHPDMTLALLLQSADALESFFACCAQLGFDMDAGAVFPRLQEAGKQAEQKMLSVTGGVNTHRGAIFSLGVLCAAAAHCAAHFECGHRIICQTAGDMTKAAVERHFACVAAASTFGERIYLEQGVRGIRGEVADGFPSIVRVWEDFSQEAALYSLHKAGVRALIRLLSRVQDTTLLKRGGREGEAFVRARARRIEEGGFKEEEILALDDEMIARRLTCGGCADLLSCLYFLYDIVQEDVQ